MFPPEVVPERIGAYHVVRRLSGAGSADVYLGKMEGPLGFERVCDLKLVQASADEVGLAEELAREAAICARLNHPVIVRMFDFFEHDGHLVLVLEHVDGVDLEKLCAHLARRKQTIGDDAVWYLAHRLAGALAHAHGATDEDNNLTPVIHRNMSPETVMIGWDGQIRLTGFGLGKILGRTPDTVAGVVKGTPGWMAPEQTRGERVTPRADVYALGMLMWSLLTSKKPPTDGTRPPPVGSLRSDIPREIAAAIDAALEPSPDKRRITCLEIEQWLEKVTNVAKGKAELTDKARLLRSARGADAPPHASVPPQTTRRRVPLRDVRPSEPPPRPEPIVRSRRTGARSLRSGPIGVVAELAGDSGVRPGLAGADVPNGASLSAEAAFPIPALPPVDMTPDPPSRETSKRSLNAVQTIAIAIGAALVVVVLGGVIVARVARAPQPAPTAPLVVVVPAPPSPSPSPSVDATTSPAASSSAGPVSLDAKGEPDVASLEDDAAYLRVDSGLDGTIYLNGSPIGPPNQPIKVQCGRYFVRIGTSPAEGQISWLAPGQSIAVPCKRSTRISARPGFARPRR